MSTDPSHNELPPSVQAQKSPVKAMDSQPEPDQKEEQNIPIQEPLPKEEQSELQEEEKNKSEKGQQGAIVPVESGQPQHQQEQSKQISHVEQAALNKEEVHEPEVLQEAERKETKQQHSEPAPQYKAIEGVQSTSQKAAPLQPELQSPKKQLTSQQILEQYLSNYNSATEKDVRQSMVNLSVENVPSQLPITSHTLRTYLHNGQEQHSLSLFRKWLKQGEEQQVQQLLSAFKASSGAYKLAQYLKKIQTLLSLADSRSSLLNLKLGLGDHKGKSSLKLGLELKHSGASEFRVVIDIKIKKKVQLKQFIENELKRLYKAKEYNIAKMCQLSIIQTDKTLKIQLTSPPLHKHLQETISLIEKITDGQDKPILKVDVDIHVKNSLKSDDLKLHPKRFVKWISEGVSASLKVEGNSKVVHHITSPLAQLFPVLGAVRAGQLSLKLKHSDNVDKWFQKLGISQLAEETPSVSEVAEILGKECLNDSLGWTGELLRKIILFACNIPNERVCFDVGVHLGRLDMHCGISVEACRELGELLKKSTAEEFN